MSGLFIANRARVCQIKFGSWACAACCRGLQAVQGAAGGYAGQLYVLGQGYEIGHRERRHCLRGDPSFGAYLQNRSGERPFIRQLSDCHDIVGPDNAVGFDQLSAVLDYAARLNEIDTDHIPPTSSVLPFDAPLREDQARPCPPRERILKNAPEKQEGMFRVPPVLE